MSSEQEISPVPEKGKIQKQLLLGAKIGSLKLGYKRRPNQTNHTNSNGSFESLAEFKRKVEVKEKEI